LTRFSGSAVAITGAANGIGRALALACIARGADVAIADKDEGALRGVASELASKGRKVSVHPLDVSNPALVDQFAAAAVSAHPGLNIVINNAGVALAGQFHEVSQDDMAWLMGINFWGVVYGTRAFLPHLAKRPEAHIVNLSSIFGIVAPPGQTAYAAAKFAVRGFSESLRHELAMNNSPVRVSVVHPGGIRTDIARSARVGAFMTDNKRRADGIERFDALTQTTPDMAAQTILDGIEANAPRILIGADARRMDLVQRLRPATYWKTIFKGIEKKIAAFEKSKNKG
jgi:NAD(P)-dependent dehydrogenase (short-subunit alcohol dehydrogenase family)